MAFTIVFLGLSTAKISAGIGIKCPSCCIDVTTINIIAFNHIFVKKKYKKILHEMQKKLDMPVYETHQAGFFIFVQIFFLCIVEIIGKVLRELFSAVLCSCLCLYYTLF